MTTTALDFAHVFRDPAHRDLMAASMVEDFRRTESFLHAFVVMPHHVHFLATLGEGISAPQLMARIKRNSSRRIRPLLDPEVAVQLTQQAGLNESQFWKRSFRGIVVCSPKFFYQKAIYTHQNPVRAGYVENAEDYRWSGASAYALGKVDADRCIDLDYLLELYAPTGLPPVSGSNPDWDASR